MSSRIDSRPLGFSLCTTAHFRPYSDFPVLAGPAFKVHLNLGVSVLRGSPMCHQGLQKQQKYNGLASEWHREMGSERQQLWELRWVTYPVLQAELRHINAEVRVFECHSAPARCFLGNHACTCADIVRTMVKWNRSEFVLQQR